MPTTSTFAVTPIVVGTLKLDFQKTLWAIGSAGIQAVGSLESLVDAAYSTQHHTSKPNFNRMLTEQAVKEDLPWMGNILRVKTWDSCEHVR